MNSDLLLVVGGAISCFGIGYALGRWIKTLRQFFDHMS